VVSFTNKSRIIPLQSPFKISFIILPVSRAKVDSKEGAGMKTINDNNQAGVILVVILVLLTLLGLVGLTFVIYAAQADCSRNPTIETRDGRCVKEIEPGRH
jgi:hypothetical protein